MDGMNKEKWLAMTKKQKREHIWEYYKLPIVGGLLVILVVGWFVAVRLNHVPSQMDVIMTDMHEPLANDEAYHAFLEEYGYEVYDKAVSLNQNMGFDFDTDDIMQYEKNGMSYDLLFAMASTGTQEILFTQPKVFASCMNDGAMLDLSTVLSEEILDKHKDRLLYMKDEESGESYPCGIDVAGNPWMEQVQKKFEGYVGIFKNADDPEIAADFVHYFLAQFDQPEA